MIDCLIFSKDRPAQLDLLLRSIDRHAPDLYRSLTVLFACTQPDAVDFYSGYKTLWKDPNGIKYWYEHPSGSPLDFETQTRHWLDQAGEIVSFLVDDDVFYRDAPDPEELPWSYRGGDYDYPFSLDGNVYAKVDIVKLLAGLHFRNPSELEAFGHTHRKRLPFCEVAHGEPCLVGIPANRVSVSSGMPHMGVDPAELNRRYLAGERLAFPEVDEVYPMGAHACLELVFA